LIGPGAGVGALLEVLDFCESPIIVRRLGIVRDRVQHLGRAHDGASCWPDRRGAG
jgi:hypothetical protein